MPYKFIVNRSGSNHNESQRFFDFWVSSCTVAANFVHHTPQVSCRLYICMCFQID